jgi:hypothetical protein
MVDRSLYIFVRSFHEQTRVAVQPDKKYEKTFRTFDQGEKTVVYCKASLLTKQTAIAKASKQRKVRKKSVQTLK